MADEDEPMDTRDEATSVATTLASSHADEARKTIDSSAQLATSLESKMEVANSSYAVNVAKMLGIAFDIENGVARQITTNMEVLRRLRGFADRIDNAQYSTSSSCLSIAFDELVAECFTNVYVDAANCAIDNSEDSMGRYFAYEPLDAVKVHRAGHLLSYVCGAFLSCQAFLQRNVGSSGTRNTRAAALYLQDIDERAERATKLLQARLVHAYLLELRGHSFAGTTHELTVAAFVRALFDNEMPADFARALLAEGASTADSSSVVAEAFSPVLSRLRYCAGFGTINSIGYLFAPFDALNTLLAIKIGATRPICALLASRDDFCPPPQSSAEGREFARRCFFGPFLGKVVAEVYGGYDSSPGQQRYHAIAECDYKDEARFLYYKNLTGVISCCTGKLHSAFHAMLANAETRDQTLNFIATMIELNASRAKMQATTSSVCDDGFMLNFLVVMLRLSSKVSSDKISAKYIFHPKSRLKLGDETRIKYDSKEVEAFASHLSFTPEDNKFPTECFFLTMQALRLGLNATIESFRQSKRHCSEMRNAIRDLETQLASAPEYARVREQSRIKAAKAFQKKALLQLISLECMLSSEDMLSDSVDFATKQLYFLTRLVNVAHPDLSNVPTEAPKIFSMMPEFMLESILDMLTFGLQTNSSLLRRVPVDMAANLLIFLCNPEYFNNPFLTAKVVEVVFMMCPSINPEASTLFYALLNSEYARGNLFPKLVKFYADVESTGASSEFYDKFNIRRSIQVIFRELWVDIAYRDRMMQVAKKCPPDFVRFLNMVINDATFLLDESLAGLKKIHEIELLMEDKASFEKLSQEDRQAKASALSESSRMVRSWMVLGNETMDLFGYFTENAPHAFYANTLGDRIASMLNYNLVQLCGPKCTELKVKDAINRFYWDPRRTVQQLIKVYLNMSGEQFAECVAHDERSYAPVQFHFLLQRLAKILPGHDYERFKNLIECAEAIYKAKAAEEEDFGDDVPDNFKDPIMDTLMSEPVRLPSGHVLDKKTILRHLLSTKNNPFTRDALTEDELVDDHELKQQIQTWIRERKQAK